MKNDKTIPIVELKNVDTFKIVHDNKEINYDEINAKMRDYFNTGATLSYEFRKTQLKKFYKVIKENEESIARAIKIDTGKPDYEIIVSEFGVVLMEISFALKHLKQWMRPKKVKTPFFNFGNKSYRYPVPKGVVLIIGPWNYPFQLLLDPLVGAIAAGCCAIIKPSDYAFETSKIINKLISETFDPAYIKVVEGDAVTATKLLDNYRWDHIFFTGSTRVGQLIYEKAAKFLTPVTLELGGLNPTIIDKTVNLSKAVDSIMIGKLINLGQSCLAPNHLFVHEDIIDEFTDRLAKAIKKTYSANLIESPNLGRINNINHFKRLVSLISEGEVVFGGKYYERELFIEPTILKNINSSTNRVLTEEIFGPILPIVPYNDTTFTLDDVLKKINTSIEPLSAYLFSNDKKVHKKILDTLKCQNILINDTIMQFVNHYLPFGGVGHSGIGGYHGNFTFEEFTLMKSIMNQNLPTLFNTIRWVRRPPYNRVKLFMTQMFFK